MNVLAKNIEYILLSHNSVIVPSLGTFGTSLTPARWIEGECLFLPPVRSVHFDSKITSDPKSLFVHSLANTYHLSFDEASRRCQELLADFHRTLVTEGSVDFGSIGVFTLEEDGQITMASCECGIITPNFYGLDALHFKRLADRKLDAEAPRQAEHVVSLITQETESGDKGTVAAQNEASHFVIHIRKTVFRYACVILFAVLAFFLIKPTPLEYSYGIQTTHAQMFLQPDMVLNVKSTPTLDELQPIKEDSAIFDAVLTDVTDEISSEGYDFDTQEETYSPSPAATQDITPEATLHQVSPAATQPKTPATAQPKTPTTSFCIVLASQVSRVNAEEYIAKLQKRNIHASLLEIGKVRRVVIQGFDSHQSAHQALSSLKAANPDMESAWVLNLK